MQEWFLLCSCFPKNPSWQLKQKLFVYITAGGSLSLRGSSSLWLLPPLPLLDLASPLMDWGLNKYKITAKTTHIMAIIAKVLSPFPWLGPGSPSWNNKMETTLFSCLFRSGFEVNEAWKLSKHWRHRLKSLAEQNFKQKNAEFLHNDLNSRLCTSFRHLCQIFLM